jgi:hypothetical protein
MIFVMLTDCLTASFPHVPLSQSHSLSVCLGTTLFFPFPRRNRAIYHTEEKRKKKGVAWVGRWPQE